MLKWLKRDADDADLQALCGAVPRNLFLQPIALLVRVVRYHWVGVALGAATFTLMAFAGVLGIGLLLPLISSVAGDGQPMPGPLAHLLDGLKSFGLNLGSLTLLLIVLAASLVEIMLRAFHHIYLIWLGESMRADFRKLLFRRLMQAPWPAVVGGRRGNLIGAIVQEASSTSKALVQAIELLGAFIVMLVYLALATIVSWQFTIGAVLFSLFVLLLAQPLYRRSRRVGQLGVINNASLLEALDEHISATKLLRSMNAEGLSFRRLSGLIDASASYFKRSLSYPLLIKMLVEMTSVTVLGLALFVSLEVLHLGFAEIMVLMAVFLRILPQAGQLQQAFQFIVASGPAFDRIADILRELDAAPLPSDGVKVRFAREIRFSGVSLSIGDRQIFQNLNLVIEPNKTTALIGASGVGKSTVVDLVTGMRTPDAGVVSVDGIPMLKIDLPTYRNDLALVPQEPAFFHDTIESNLRVFVPKASSEEIWRALDKVGARQFVEQRPEGLQALLGDNAIRISGGQRQRLAIARALLRTPRLLILDEPTSALDAMSEEEVFYSLQAIRGATTILVVTHRTNVLGFADAVYRITPEGAVLQTRPSVGHRE